VLTKTQLHGQTGQTGQDYRRPEIPATTTSTSPATNTVAAVRFITKRLEQTQLHDQTNTMTKSPVATPSTAPAEDDMLSTTELREQTHLHGRTNTQPESPVATPSTYPDTDAVLFTTELLKQTHLQDQTNTEVETLVVAPSTTPAADAALSTTELLEQILSHFDIKELVLLRRVSHHWSDVMAESPVLQRAMFLAPEPELPFEWHEERLDSDKLRYTKEVSGTVDAFLAYKSSRFNPLFFETRLDAGMDQTHLSSRLVQLYPRRNLKDVSASKLFSRMLVAQPPVKFANLGCTTQLYNRQGIRISDAARVMEYEDEHSCEFGHVFSLIVPWFMFPTRDEEEEGQIMRQYTALSKHCTDQVREDERSRLIAVNTDGEHLIV